MIRKDTVHGVRARELSLAPRNDTRRICVAQIGAPHGVRGEVRLKTFTADPMAVARYGPLASEDGSRSFEIETLRQGKGVLIARLRGVDSRDAAERLTNIQLFVGRDQLPKAEEEEFYHADLIGLRVVDRSGSELGTVLAVHDFGAGDLIEVQPAGGGSTWMLPFTKAAVPEVDLAGGRLIVEPPEVTVAEPPLAGEN